MTIMPYQGIIKFNDVEIMVSYSINSHGWNMWFSKRANKKLFASALQSVVKINKGSVLKWCGCVIDLIFVQSNTLISVHNGQSERTDTGQFRFTDVK
jgi:hypothetical protein